MARWPEPKIVAAALRGMAEVMQTRDGRKFVGIPASPSHIAAAVHPDRDPIGVVFCQHCNTLAPLPDPPKGQNAPLCEPGSRMHGEFVLTTVLYPFAREHEACPEPLEVSA
jgi:hypothetical protein